MPSLYAHNKFGKLVISELPDNLKAVIKHYPNPFRLGLQGPDFLFFYKAFTKNNVNQYGVKLHKCDTFPFMENAINVIDKYGYNSAEFSYIMGFICHFTLDNACHPYVHQSMEQTSCGHIEIEGDFEHLLLTNDGFIPSKFQTHKLVPTDYITAKSASKFYDGISCHTANSCMRWMRLIKHLFVAPGRFKQRIFHLLMKSTLHYKSFRGLMIEPEVNAKCRPNSEQMYVLLKCAVPQAVRLIYNFKASVKNPTRLSADFHYDFNGNRQ